MDGDMDGWVDGRVDGCFDWKMSKLVEGWMEHGRMERKRNYSYQQAQNYSALTEYMECSPYSYHIRPMTQEAFPACIP